MAEGIKIELTLPWEDLKEVLRLDMLCCCLLLLSLFIVVIVKSVKKTSR